MNKNTLYHISAAVFLVLLQLFVVRELHLWGVGFCFIYVSILLLIPINFTKGYALIIAFFLGLFIDIFYNTPGINAFSCVLLIFLKPYLFGVLPMQTNFEEQDLITPNNIGFINFSVFGFILLIIHHFCLFQLEAYASEFIGQSLLKAFISTLFTLFTTIVLFYLIFSTKARR